MSTNVITILAIISIFYMDCGVQRAFKNLKKKNERKLVILMSAGSLSTLILTISLFQNIQF